MAGQSKDPMRGGTVNTGDFHPLERSRPGPLERLDDAESGQNSHCLRTHVLGARLVPGELSPIYRENREARLGQQGGRSAAGRSDSDHQRVHLPGKISQASAIRPKPGHR
jgi:hypothetical protein